MNAVEVIAERIEQHVEGWNVFIDQEAIFDAAREVEIDRMARVTLRTGTVEKGSGLRSEKISFTVYVYDDPESYTQVTVNFDGSSDYDPINYLYYYDSGEELRLTSN
jgi:hypothetical protein